MVKKTPDTSEMFQIIINSLSAFKQEVLKKFKEVDERFDNMDNKIDGMEGRLTKRIDTIGRQLAYLEDDATREEFNGLEKRVGTLERKSFFAL